MKKKIILFILLFFSYMNSCTNAHFINQDQWICGFYYEIGNDLCYFIPIKEIKYPDDVYKNLTEDNIEIAYQLYPTEDKVYRFLFQNRYSFKKEDDFFNNFITFAKVKFRDIYTNDKSENKWKVRELTLPFGGKFKYYLAFPQIKEVKKCNCVD